MPLHLGNSTIETISSYETLAAQPGVLQEAHLATPPTKVNFSVGDHHDVSGATFRLVIDGKEYLVPLGDVDDGQGKNLRIDWSGKDFPNSVLADINGQDWSASEGFTVSLNGVSIETETYTYYVSAYSSVLENNSWETIARAAAAGKAKNLWSIGDTKKLTLKGTKYTFRIVAFDFQNLASTDAYYENTSYNNNSKKTGITFMATMALDTTARHLDTDRGSKRWSWSQSYINTETLPNLFDSSAAASYIRTVSLVSTQPVSPAGYTETSNSKYYLPSVYEMMGIKWYYTYDADPDGNGQITYFANGNSKAMISPFGSQVNYWLRSSYDQTGDGEAQYAYLNSPDSSIGTAGGTLYYHLVPMFDI